MYINITIHIINEVRKKINTIAFEVIKFNLTYNIIRGGS